MQVKGEAGNAGAMADSWSVVRRIWILDSRFWILDGWMDGVAESKQLRQGIGSYQSAQSVNRLRTPGTTAVGHGGKRKAVRPAWRHVGNSGRRLDCGDQLGAGGQASLVSRAAATGVG